ncbi:PREDICTED: uncharacterized protein LOC109227820 [Nicotiana attenuata]|uniref:uncharacterized protein LOC109227820 n=1 Tax=Nicotiana attenuata TaxID=49451 RepID=UPI0009059B3F|nr:PREDICTED: uncharacterized protein LOC109227820 [Nicotiana attenuata]
MLKEFLALEINETWDIVPLPPHKKAILCKLVYKIKQRADGSIERYKSSLVIRGDTQKDGNDFTETFSPVVKLTAIKCLLTIIVKWGWTVFQLDVNNVFLHGDLHKEVYMKVPPGVVPLLILVLWSADSRSLFMALGRPPNSGFQSGLRLCISRGYVANMGAHVSDPGLYRRLIGKLNFVQHIRPDISLSVQHLTQFLQKPQVPHMLAAIHVLRYLLNDPAQGILLSNSSDFSLQAYSDSDWAACSISNKLITSYYITLGAALSLGRARNSPLYLCLQLSQSALHIAKNPVFHERMKHIEIDCHYVRTCLDPGLISLQFVSNAQQLADIMIKALSGPLHHGILYKLVCSVVVFFLCVYDQFSL